MIDPNLEVFNCPDIETAKKVILWPGDGGNTTDERWEKETAWIMPRLVFPMGHILDFGCGIGRLAKGIVSVLRPVTGVEVSPTMREHAVEYVGSPNFQVCAQVIHREAPFVGGLAVWVLQHVIDPRAEIATLARLLQAGAPFYVMNRFHRAVPGADGLWHPDDINIVPLLMQYFDVERAEAVPEELCAGGAYFAKFVRKAA